MARHFADVAAALFAELHEYAHAHAVLVVRLVGLGLIPTGHDDRRRAACVKVNPACFDVFYVHHRFEVAGNVHFDVFAVLAVAAHHATGLCIKLDEVNDVSTAAAFKVNTKSHKLLPSCDCLASRLPSPVMG